MKNLFILLLTISLSASAQNTTPKRLYLANDTHVDLMYNGTEDEWDRKILDMAEFYLKLGEDTKNEPDVAKRSKWNYDCAYWLYTLEKKTSPAYFARIIDQIKNQQASVPYNFTLPIYGAFSTESILRSFYFGGYLERKYGIDVDIAVCQENATIPLGLASLWAGSGAKYSWKGVCFCATKTKNHGVRDHEIYRYAGLDGQSVLMKWYSILGNNSELGGYSELLEPTVAVWQMDTLCGTKRYPYRIAGAFGKGWDNMVNYSYDMVWHLNHRTRPGTKLFISNELDFFKDFETTYGPQIPTETRAYGNEWDLLPASLSNVTSGIRLEMERLRNAEALATIFQKDIDLNSIKSQKADFMYGLSTISAHGWTVDGPISKKTFTDWARKQHANIKLYVDTLTQISSQTWAEKIPMLENGIRLSFFNALNWKRNATVEIASTKKENYLIINERTNTPVPYGYTNNGSLIVYLRDIEPLTFTNLKITKTNKVVKSVQSSFKINKLQIETPFYKIQLNTDGSFASLIEKSSQKQWSGDKFNSLGESDLNAKMEVVENNNLRLKLKFTGFKPLKYSTLLTFYANSDAIDFKNEILQNFNDPIYWHYKINLDNASVYHEEIGAVIRAAPNSTGGHYADKRSRVDHLTSNHFVQVQNKNHSAVLSNLDALFFKLGNSTPDTLDYTSSHIQFLVGGQIDKVFNLGIPNQGGDSVFVNHFRFKPFSSKITFTEAMKTAFEHQNPIMHQQAKGLPSQAMAQQNTYLQVNDPDQILYTLKPAEDGGSLCRFWNLAEKPKDYQITTSLGKNIFLSTHVETAVKDISESKTINAKTQQIVSVLIKND